VSWPTLKMTLRLRLASTGSAAFGLIAVLVAVGALFPAVGHTIGKLSIPKGVSELLGGADYGTITGWFRGEIASIYGPLVIAALAITGASAATAGEEEDRILAVVLAHPIRRSQLVAAKAAAIATVVVIIALATWAGMIVGVALGGGGISVGHLAAFSVQLAFFGFAAGAVAIALGAGPGRRSLAAGVAASVAIVGWLINGFAPLRGRSRLDQVPLALLLLRGARSAHPRHRHRRDHCSRRGHPDAHRSRHGRHRTPRPPRITTRTDGL
jgi:ABC-type transport system involved in multi-copper enzyme maturation permease subunit